MMSRRSHTSPLIVHERWSDQHRSAEATIVVVGTSTLGLLVEGLVHANMLSANAMIGQRHGSMRQRVVRAATWDEAMMVTGRLDCCVVIAGTVSRPEGPQLRDAAGTPVGIYDAQTVLERACRTGGWRRHEKRSGAKRQKMRNWLLPVRTVLMSWRWNRLSRRANARVGGSDSRRAA